MSTQAYSSIEDFEKSAAGIAEKRRSAADRPCVIVGGGTCGMARGAGKVAEAFKERDRQAQAHPQGPAPRDRLPRLLPGRAAGGDRARRDLLHGGRSRRRGGDPRRDGREEADHREAGLQGRARRAELLPRERRPVLQEAAPPAPLPEQAGRSEEHRGLHRHRRLRRPGQGPQRDARAGHRGGREVRPARAGRRGLLDGAEVEVLPRRLGQPQVPHLQRRRRRPRRLHGPQRAGGEPSQRDRGHADRGLRDRRREGLRLRAHGVPARDRAREHRHPSRPGSTACWARTSWDRGSTSICRSAAGPAPSCAARRRR